MPAEISAHERTDDDQPESLGASGVDAGLRQDVAQPPASQRLRDFRVHERERRRRAVVTQEGDLSVDLELESTRRTVVFHLWSRRVRAYPDAGFNRISGC